MEFQYCHAEAILQSRWRRPVEYPVSEEENGRGTRSYLSYQHSGGNLAGRKDLLSGISRVLEYALCLPPGSHPLKKDTCWMQELEKTF